MKYEDKSFKHIPNTSKEYADNYDRIFGKGSDSVANEPSPTANGYQCDICWNLFSESPAFRTDGGDACCAECAARWRLT